MSRSREQPDDRPPLGEFVRGPVSAKKVEIEVRRRAAKLLFDLTWLARHLLALLDDPLQREREKAVIERLEAPWPNDLAAARELASVMDNHWSEDAPGFVLRDAVAEVLSAGPYSDAVLEKIIDRLAEELATGMLRDPYKRATWLQGAMTWHLSEAIRAIDRPGTAFEPIGKAADLHLLKELRRRCADRGPLRDDWLLHAVIAFRAGFRAGQAVTVRGVEPMLLDSFRVDARQKKAARKARKEERQKAIDAELRARRRPDGTLPRGARVEIARALAARFAMTEEAARKALHRALSRRPAKCR